MPRIPRDRPGTTGVVIPTTALVASAVRYPGKSPGRVYTPNKEWQKECYRHYAICGEARYAAIFFGQALSRATLKVVKKELGRVTDVTDGQAVELLDDLFNGKDGQSQMLESLGVHLTVAGECYLIGRQIDGVDTWEIVSILEVIVNGVQWKIDYGDGRPAVDLKESDVVIRIWRPNPAKRIEADSPFRSLLPVLSEIEWLTRHIFAQCSSRLAGAGILFLSQGITFPTPPTKDGETPEPVNAADAVMLALADAMLEPMNNPESPAATVPTVVLAPGDEIDKSKLMHFWSDLDEKALEMRSAAVHRFALGMDLPVEQVLGMSSNEGTGGGNSNGVSHWGAWQIEESTIKFHIEPMLELVCNAITIGYLRPQLDEETGEYLLYDTSALRLRPDRSKEAFELYDRGLVSARVLLQENGFNPDEDMPADKEFKQWLLRKIASGSATPDQVGAALKALGVDLGIAVGASPEVDTRETRPTPTLEDHPTRPRTPGEGGPPPEVLYASEALVFRALERAGNRIRQKTQIKPPGVPSYEMHTLFAANGDTALYLEDAFACAPQVLNGITDVEKTIQSLNAYCVGLMAEQVPHTRERLAKWLEATA